MQEQEPPPPSWSLAGLLGSLLRSAGRRWVRRCWVPLWRSSILRTHPPTHPSLLKHLTPLLTKWQMAGGGSRTPPKLWGLENPRPPSSISPSPVWITNWRSVPPALFSHLHFSTSCFIHPFFKALPPPIFSPASSLLHVLLAAQSFRHTPAVIASIPPPPPP